MKPKVRKLLLVSGSAIKIWAVLHLRWSVLLYQTTRNFYSHITVCVCACVFFSLLLCSWVFFVSLLTLHSPMYQKSSIIRQCASVCEFVEFLAVCAYTPVVSVCMCVLFASFLWNEHLSRHHLPSLLSRTRSNTLTSEPNQREHTTQLGWLFFRFPLLVDYTVRVLLFARSGRHSIMDECKPYINTVIVLCLHSTQIQSQSE